MAKRPAYFQVLVGKDLRCGPWEITSENEVGTERSNLHDSSCFGVGCDTRYFGSSL